MASRSRKQATRGGSRRSWPAWVWLAIGVLLGLVVAAIFLAGNWVPVLRGKNLPQPNPEAVAPRESEPPLADTKEAKKKNYDFYSVLPEMEVVIPDAELSAKARAEAQARAQAARTATPASTPTVVPAGTRYLLQAGSYPDVKGADEVKAKLALVGFVAQVHPVTINGKTWNRVRLGPYSTASELEAAKAALAENGINAIALKEEAGR